LRLGSPIVWAGLSFILVASIRSQVAFVFQEETALFDATIEENIRLAKPDATEIRRAAPAATSWNSRPAEWPEPVPFAPLIQWLNPRSRANILGPHDEAAPSSWRPPWLG
jgi:hypothetical protein